MTQKQPFAELPLIQTENKEFQVDDDIIKLTGTTFLVTTAQIEEFGLTQASVKHIMYKLGYSCYVHENPEGIVVVITYKEKVAQVVDESNKVGMFKPLPTPEVGISTTITALYEVEVFNHDIAKKIEGFENLLAQQRIQDNGKLRFVYELHLQVASPLTAEELNFIVEVYRMAGWKGVQCKQKRDINQNIGALCVLILNAFREI